VADQLDIDGPAAPPRDNGELVFDAPWQGRAFAVTVSLHEDGRLEWDDFRRELVVQLADAADAEPGTYWAAWLRATESVVERLDLVRSDERVDRLETYRRRPPGHDHDHGHG
jgi:nitrile hydratase accessory protein